MVLTDSGRKNVAANSSYTVDEVAEADTQLDRAIQSRLGEHFERSRLSPGKDYWLLEESLDAPSVWLAFTRYKLKEEVDKADVEIEDGLLLRLAYAHLEAFQEQGYTIEVPGPVGRKLKDPFFFPICVSYPEGWEAGEFHTSQRFEEYILRYKMNPAEALDYWAVIHRNRDLSEWAGIRDVQKEAIRKNIRQAKEKLDDEERGASHQKERLKAVPLSKIPEGDPHDPDRDVFYVPTEESLDEKSS